MKARLGMALATLNLMQEHGGRKNLINKIQEDIADQLKADPYAGMNRAQRRAARRSKRK